MTDAVIDFPVQDARTGDRRLSQLLDAQRNAYLLHGPLSEERRAAALDGLHQAVLKYQEALVEAVRQDFGHRSAHETRLADIFSTLGAIRHARKHFRRWMKPQRRSIALTFQPGRGRVLYQPLGVVGIISPWNYPIQLGLTPLAAAVAAGNRVMLKPSEYTPATAALLERVLAEVFEPVEVAVVQGGAEVAQAFSRLRFDHLLFTGSTPVGRHVMRAAAENLVPVTLELGGKSPTIVAADYPLDKAAESIAGGKLFNAGQTCIAPDYVLLPRGREEAFIAAYRAAVTRFYPRLDTNPDYTAIVNDRHYQRLTGLLEDAKRRGARVETINPGNEVPDPARRKLQPTLLTGVPDEAAVMREEIFGPILPLVPYDSLEQAYAYINDRPRPLALYLYSHDEGVVDRTLERTVSGGVTVNDTLLHVAQEELPFGGVGESGIGAYHGEAGFRTFSHAKSVFHQSRLNGTGLMRPPYGAKMERLLKFLIR
ncbi:coniferyl aldehyde dehydrogenase [Rhodospirillum centenum]|uniref:Aldehyde dehydrogenase n=1 Tax=Rhodospirillum centenum (strain ATCC 51521 / SW) TaxID=414684 RepID=B6IWC7_RHOCS|nr:coniferyl aldehyde dehydrogenase [Rhodospirillum centenum]ACJ00601.1 coniferyl aldehyde dehydrogenase [Rhodospirillum centenum SW]